MAILVVDDNAAGLYVKIRQLAALGYRVHEAANAASAMAVINAHPIDLAIIDVRLPDMSGIELCKLIKRRNANLLVLQRRQRLRPQSTALRVSIRAQMLI